MQPPEIEVRFAPKSGHSSTNVRFLPDRVRLAPRSGHSEAHAGLPLMTQSRHAGDEVYRVGSDDDDFFPVTWSMMLADATEDVSDPGFGPDQNIVVEIETLDCCGGDTQFNAMVTFYLRGVTEGDVNIEVHENTDNL